MQMRARSFALRDAFPDVLKGLISVEEALDNHAGADQLALPTIDAIAEAAPPASPSAPPRAYQLTTKRGTTTFQTDEEWLSASRCFLPLEFYSGATGQAGRFSEGVCLRRVHPARSRRSRAGENRAGGVKAKQVRLRSQAPRLRAMLFRPCRK
jgi:hypothetical protein